MMSKVKKSLLVLVAAASALFATAALAGEITLFHGRNFAGESLTLNGTAPDLASTGFNDSAASVIVRDGVWEACTDIGFQGRCMQLQPGEYRGIGAVNDRIASVREIVSVSRSAPPVVVATASPRLVLFEGPGFGGRSVEVTQTMSRLDGIRYYAGAGAAVVTGGTWRLCSGEMFRGECED